MSARIAICLFEAAIQEFDVDKLMGGQSLKPIPLNLVDDRVALYLKERNEIIPEWVDIVKEFSKVKVSETMTASSGAILFLKVQNRIMACCFGTSVANINRE